MYVLPLSIYSAYSYITRICTSGGSRTQVRWLQPKPVTITLRSLHQPFGKMSYLNQMHEKGNVSIREEKKYRECSIRQVTSNIKSNVKEIDIKVSINYDKTNLMLI